MRNWRKSVGKIISETVRRKGKQSNYWETWPVMKSPGDLEKIC